MVTDALARTPRAPASLPQTHPRIGLLGVRRGPDEVAP